MLRLKIRFIPNKKYGNRFIFKRSILRVRLRCKKMKNIFNEKGEYRNGVRNETAFFCVRGKKVIMRVYINIQKIQM